ncbi:MAG: transporter, family, tetracycline resistance protein [Alphaproteobacteria bacterium]|nr:transporter, family, tetracycline resistance protein [Alphaproteobacteria bacterium]
MTEPQSAKSPLAIAPRRAAFIFVFITVLLDMLALGIIIPVLPKLVVDFLAGDTARAAEIYGLFGTAFLLAALILVLAIMLASRTSARCASKPSA